MVIFNLTSHVSNAKTPLNVRNARFRISGLALSATVANSFSVEDALMLALLASSPATSFVRDALMVVITAWINSLVRNVLLVSTKKEKFASLTVELAIPSSMVPVLYAPL